MSRKKDKGGQIARPSSEPRRAPSNADIETRAEARITQVEFSGPLPPPAWLAQYDQIVPGGADRLLKMLETESTHRREKLDCEQEHVHVIEKRSQAFAFVISILGLGVAGILAWTDQGTPASIVVSSIFGAGGLLYWLKSRQEREQQAEEKESTEK